MDALLIHRCKIQTRIGSTNDFGEQTYSWSDTYTGVQCRLAAPNGAKERLENGEFVTSAPTLFLKSSQTVTENNRIVGTTGFLDTYDITKVQNMFNSTSIHHIEVNLKKVV